MNETFQIDKSETNKELRKNGLKLCQSLIKYKKAILGRKFLIKYWKLNQHKNDFRAFT